VQPAGAGRYILELVRALAHRDDVQIELIARKGDLERWRQIDGGAGVHGLVPNARPARLVYEQVLLSRQLTSLGVQVHHGPHYTIPRRCPIPSVVTIHDMTFFDRPDVHQATKVRFFRSAIRHAASSATVIVCVSDRTAERFAAHFSTTAPILVAPHGIDHDRFTTIAPPGADAATLRRLGLGGTARRIVHVGTLEPRKGIITLLEAFERVLEVDPGCELIFAGQRGWGLESFDQALMRSSAKAHVRLLGYVDDDDVPALLRSASVLAYPSVDEGFGLPALEGLACGAPVVTTSGSVMEDLCGPAAWLAPPGDPAALAGVLVEILGSPAEDALARRDLGTKRAGEFTWTKTASLHVEAYALANSLRRPQRGK
jgi:glycosyltransferase involved in cell wall biosynthesis